jgi:predicted RNA-binding protein Jag
MAETADDRMRDEMNLAVRKIVDQRMKFIFDVSEYAGKFEKYWSEVASVVADRVDGILKRG